MKSTRRDFIKKLGVTGITATAIVEADTLEASPTKESEKSRNEILKGTRQYNAAYTGENLNRVAFPIGGMGSGMYCLEGNGAISHMSVRNRPEVFHEPGMFAALSIKQFPSSTKVLEGPAPDWKKFGQPDSGNGSGGTIFGLPRFEKCDFLPRFPFATINLSDADLPIEIQIIGWSPFIPGDADSSSLPAGILEYKIINRHTQGLDLVFTYSSKNFLRVDNSKGKIRSTGSGFILTNDGTPEKPFQKADFAILTDQSDTIVDHCWFRGGWFDPLTMAWESIKEGNPQPVAPVEEGAPGATLFVPFSLLPGQEKIVKVFTAWYVPESNLKFGGDAKETDKCDPASGCCSTTSDLGFGGDTATVNYKPWYASRYNSIEAVLDYLKANYNDLKTKSQLFSDTFYSSTLPPEVMEAVAANLTILKSPTVLRQHDGRLWNFEGCGDNNGCCHGSCTHVWNYAQALPHLFPALERSLRHTEFCENQSREGHQTFRAALPIRPVNHEFYAAADGQLGGIMKVYREWRISGDTEWLKKMYPMTKVSMDYCIKTWDPKNKGVVEEPHHNTYDIEFWGPDGMCTSFYLGALQAMVQMGRFLKKDVKVYQSLYEKGKKFCETELYDGEYFIQKITVDGLNAPNPITASQKSYGGEYSDEAKKLLEKEGPKYQYGKGCLSDGVLGAWIARMCGLEDPLDKEKVKSHLVAVHKYNLKKDLSDHVNPQRPSFAMGNEGGLLLCSWPKGGKLSLPFVYSNEVWTGIEYQVASHLMLMGKVEEGLEVVRACRDRYDGKARNPFNEYECGHWYARALSSCGLLQGLTGVRYDAVEKTLYIDSKIGDFTSFLATQFGYGTVSLNQGKPFIKMASGTMAVEKVIVSGRVTSFTKS
jgi:uncharacterized protein (DUF608 family)